MYPINMIAKLCSKAGYKFWKTTALSICASGISSVEFPAMVNMQSDEASVVPGGKKISFNILYSNIQKPKGTLLLEQGPASLAMGGEARVPLSHECKMAPKPTLNLIKTHHGLD